MTSRPALTAITLNPDGGGVATVARLVRKVMHEEWGPACPVYELSDSARTAPFARRAAERVRFGARVTAAELTGRASWFFHSHLALTRVHRVVPRRLGRPYAVFVYGIEVWTRLTSTDRRLIEDATLVVACSAHTARRALEVNPGLPSFSVCPLGHSVAGPAPSARTPLAQHVVLTVGRMVSTERYKGHDQLIEALPVLRRDVPDARLVFVGTGDDVDRLRRKAQDCGVGEHVTFTGFLSDDALRQAYADASVFAMPSRGEGFGLTYLEAMAAGLPCIGSVHDAAPEIIEDGVTGFLIDQQDNAQLVDRLRTLLTDPSRRNAMGGRGRVRWEQEFTYEQFRRRFLAVLRPAFRGHVSAQPAPWSVPG
jgi:phosphatidylinositol alpha-1,6-mannosyltransferase